MKLVKIVELLDEVLDIKSFEDYSNNGLQLEGSDEVKTAAFGVDASVETFERAAALKADLIVVHHGLSWGKEPRFFTGMTAKRLGFLFENRISLYACHLPLDANKELGNNAVLADMVKLKKRVDFFPYCNRCIGVAGRLEKGLKIKDVAAIYEDKLDTKGKIYGDRELKVSKLAICSGGGGLEALECAAAAGMELLITGEFNHTMYHPAREMGVNVVSLGHYASETTGIRKLMEYVETNTRIDCRFIDIPTGL